MDGRAPVQEAHHYRGWALVRNTTFQQHARQHPDPIRIVAISVSIALNATMLAFLMRPPEFTLPTEQPDTNSRVLFITPDPVPPTPPVVKIVKQRPLPPLPTPQVMPHPAVTPVITHTDTAMSTKATQTTQTDNNQQTIGSSNPPTVEASLTPIASPAPTYPFDALRNGITGTVELELLVGVDGSVLQVRITHSSGNRQLDNAARDQVLRNWRFQPALRGGVAVQALGRVPIVFSLDGH